MTLEHHFENLTIWKMKSFQVKSCIQMLMGMIIYIDILTYQKITKVSKAAAINCMINLF